MSDVPLMELTEHDYLQMEEALSQTARGRAFLRMRDRRSRVVAVDEFHRLTSALEQQINRLRGVDPGVLPRLAPAGGLGSGLGDNLQLQQELMSITQVVRETRSDIAALRPADTGSNRIEAATGELDEIVAATERATTDILNATEKIQEITQGIPRTDPDIAEMVDAIDAWSIEIMTACAFQDITGQRTTKVVNTLRYIEQRVNTMIEIWGVDRIATASETESMGEGTSHRKLGDTRPDAHLLNGPQLGGPEVSQDDIDALFDTLATQIPQVLERVEPAETPAPPPPPP
ncbi:protein phosphatase CheZ, partial [Azospirillum brasilense]|uniref:protein phosphatase CheZ n=1 Tax=Azospirillum brasilense TaxID=192 RepID=UPI000E0AD307